VPARNFIDLVNSLPPDQVNLDMDAATLSLALRCGSVRAVFRGIAAEEFPAIPNPGEGDGVSVEAGDLRRGLSLVTFASASDESNRVLTGVLAEFDGDYLTMAAADGYRLAVCKTPLIHPVTHPFSVIIPSRALAELARILSGSEEPVTVATSWTHNQTLFRLKETVLNTQLIDGNFPDIRRIIPAESKTVVTIGREEWLQACKRAAIFARDGSNIVKLSVSSDEMTVSAASAEYGEGATSLSVNVTGNPLEIAFNVRFLIDVLSALDVPQVTLGMNEPNRPGLIRAVGDDAFTYVVMPMHLGR
jgi:DNA polymerase-3 subunit beta